MPVKRAVQQQPPPTPEEFLARFPPHTQALANDLRALVKRALPDVREKVISGWALIGYRVSNGKREAHAAFISPKPEAVYFGFEYGILLRDPDRLLEGGDLKQVRFVTVRSHEDIRAEAFTAFIVEAARIAGLTRTEKLHRLAEREEILRAERMGGHH